MPKELNRESEEYDKVPIDESQSLRGSRRNLLTTKNSLKKKAVSIMNATNKSSLFSVASKSKKRKEKEQIFVSLNMEG